MGHHVWLTTENFKVTLLASPMEIYERLLGVLKNELDQKINDSKPHIFGAYLSILNFPVESLLKPTL